MSTNTAAQTGAEVMAQFLPASPFVAKLGIVAEVLDGEAAAKAIATYKVG